MLTEKAIAICLLEVLTEYSDDNHILSMGEITGKIEQLYGLTPDRRTIYSALDTLLELGYDISLYKENGQGYFIRDRHLEVSEAHLLTDAICAFPFISEKQTAQLLRKVHALLSVHNRRSIRHLSVIRADQKTINKQVFYNIETLDEAIEQKKKVTFDYYDYGIDKQLHKRRERKYTVNPYGMVYSNQHYYLVCIMAQRSNLSMYRVDRIQDIEITGCELDERDTDFDPQTAIQNSVYGHTGEIGQIEMLVHPQRINDVIDQFGTNITISENYDGRLKIVLKASLMGMKYWALQYLDHVEITAPIELRNEIKNSIAANAYVD